MKRVVGKPLSRIGHFCRVYVASARLARRWIVALLVSILGTAAAHAATATLGEGVTIDFPGVPHAVDHSLELRVPAADGHGKALLTAGEIDVPWWMHAMLRRAPDLFAWDAAMNQVSAEATRRFPNASVARLTSFVLPGFTGVEMELRELRGNPADPFKRDLSRLVGKAIVIDGALYLYAVADDERNPASPEAVSRFLDSFRTGETRVPGDPVEQLVRIVGAVIALALLLVILMVIGVVVLIRRLRARARARV